MTTFRADPTQDKGMTFPDGEYFLNCTDVQDTNKDGEELFSKKSGHKQYILEMTVSEGPYKGRKLWHYLTFIPPVAGENNGHGMVLKCLKSFGLPFDGDLDFDTDLHPSKFKGQTVRAKVAIEQNDIAYEPKNVIKRFLVVGDPSRVPPAPEAAGDFDAEALEKEAQARKAPAPAPAKAAAAAPVKSKAPWRK